MFEPLGTRIRRQRRRLGLTLDDLSAKTGISKPYLSLIETGRVPNPPSDEKVVRLEVALAFKSGDLLTQAHLIRTPQDVRAMLAELMQGKGAAFGMSSGADAAAGNAAGGAGTAVSSLKNGISDLKSKSPASPPTSGNRPGASAQSEARGAPSSSFLDAAYLSGVLRQLVDQSAGNLDPAMQTRTVPVINKVSAGYPKDFTDLAYPKGVADTYISCPDVSDPDAFAARVSGDSMTPKYREGDIVIFSPKAPVVEGVDCFVRFDDGQTTFKRVFFESDDKGRDMVRLQPRNERYRPQVILGERITGLYRAVFKYQSVDD